ncbi:hypothetical protein ACFFRR_006257 [Megaselia abdita]
MSRSKSKKQKPRSQKFEPIVWSDSYFMDKFWLTQYRWIQPDIEKKKLAAKVFLHAYFNNHAKVTADQIRSSSLILINHLKLNEDFIIPWIVPSEDTDDGVEVEDIFGILDNPSDFPRITFNEIDYKFQKYEKKHEQDLENFVEWTWNGLEGRNKTDSVLTTLGILALFVVKISTKPPDYISKSIQRHCRGILRQIMSKYVPPIPPPNRDCWDQLSEAHIRDIGFLENIYTRCSYAVLVDQNDSPIQTTRRLIIRESIWDSMYMNGLQNMSNFLKIMKKYKCSANFFIENFCHLKNASIIKKTIERFKDGGPEELTFGVSRLLNRRCHMDLNGIHPEILYFNITVTSVMKESFNIEDTIWGIPAFKDVNRKILSDGITFGGIIYKMLKEADSEEKEICDSGITIELQKSLVTV